MWRWSTREMWWRKVCVRKGAPYLFRQSFVVQEIRGLVGGGAYMVYMRRLRPRKVARLIRVSRTLSGVTKRTALVKREASGEPDDLPILSASIHQIMAGA